MERPTTDDRPPCVLVVEDEVMIRLMLAEQLRETGLTVIEAGTAAEAMSCLELGNRVDLVFTDVRMPGDWDGLDLARWVRSHHPAMPIIVTSGFANRADATTMGWFLLKPYAFETATAMVLRAVGR